VPQQQQQQQFSNAGYTNSPHPSLSSPRDGSEEGFTITPHMGSLNAPLRVSPRYQTNAPNSFTMPPPPSPHATLPPSSYPQPSPSHPHQSPSFTHHQSHPTGMDPQAPVQPWYLNGEFTPYRREIMQRM
jgi:hypothetical protein